MLIEAGHEVVSTDLIDRGFGLGGQDFLKSDRPLAKHIITNPPYGTNGLPTSLCAALSSIATRPAEAWRCS